MFNKKLYYLPRELELFWKSQVKSEKKKKGLKIYIVTNKTQTNNLQQQTKIQ